MKSMKHVIILVTMTAAGVLAGTQAMAQSKAVNPAPETLGVADGALIHQTIDPFVCFAPGTNDEIFCRAPRLDIPGAAVGEPVEVRLKMPSGKVLVTQGPYAADGRIIFKFGSRRSMSGSSDDVAQISRPADSKQDNDPSPEDLGNFSPKKTHVININYIAPDLP